jgi:SAM-dependent methyltransferase
MGLGSSDISPREAATLAKSCRWPPSMGRRSATNPAAPIAMPKRRANRADVYSTEWFRTRAGGAEASSRVIVPLVLELVEPASVVDVGCGTGSWLATFRELGVERTRGVDGNWVPREQLQIPPEDFLAADLSAGIPLDERFDLAVSLEVAEHLPEQSADKFVESLTRLAPIVLFSGAVPGQPGHGHINAQWPEYWIERFGRHGYVPIDALRPRIWADNSVKYFYRQNAILFADRDRLPDHPALSAAASATEGPVRAIVHPRLYEVYLRRDVRRMIRPYVEPARAALSRLRARFRR